MLLLLDPLIGRFHGLLPCVNGSQEYCFLAQMTHNCRTLDNIRFPNYPNVPPPNKMTVYAAVIIIISEFIPRLNPFMITIYPGPYICLNKSNKEYRLFFNIVKETIYAKFHRGWAQQCPNNIP